MSKNIEAPELSQKLARAFQQYENGLNGQKQTALHKRRQEALQAVQENRFPSTRVEAWKYTNVAKLLQTPFHLVVNQSRNGSLDQATLEAVGIPDLHAHRLVFLNGHFVPALSDHEALGDGVHFEPLARLDQLGEMAENHFARYANYKELSESFTALNTALAADGAVLRVGRNQAIEKPIHLINITDARQGSMLAQPRYLMVLEEGAEATFIEQTRVLGNEGVGLTNTVAEVVLSPNSRAEYYRVQDDRAENAYYIGKLQAHQPKDAQFYNLVSTTGNVFTRNDLNIEAAGENGESYLYGIYALDGKQLADNHTFMDHAKPHCYSNEFYRGVMGDKSTGVFNGRIFVRKHAQKTDAYQNSANVLLSDNATIHAKPQLEIYADDVTCSHGATSGNLDDSSLFYMQARGIPREQARRMLTYAFAAEVLENCRYAPLQEYLREELARKLHFKL